jgi:hypothetical protein
MGNMVMVDCEGKGGIAVSWRSGVDLVLQSRSKNHIDVDILGTGGGRWWFTGVYGEAQAEFKYKTWELLEALHVEDDEHLPWLCAGDFNEFFFSS